MRNDYFNTDEFKAILNKYEASKEQGSTCYFDAEEFVDIADYYLLSDLPEDAMDVLDLGLSQHPGDEDLMSTKSGAFIFMHMFPEAKQLLDTLDSDDSNVLYQQAQLAYAIDNDVERAEILFSEWIEKEEESSKYDEKEEREERIRDAYLHILTSFIELRGNKYDEELVKRWVEEYYARFAPLGKYECDLILADMIRNESMTDMVEKIYTSLLEYDPYINCGWTVLSASQVMNGKYSEALESADFALAINPDDLDAKLNKAHAYYALGQKDMALPLFEYYIDKTNDANQYLPYAITLITQERIDEAVAYLEKTEEYIEFCGNGNRDYFAQTYFEMAEAYLAISMIDKADACITKALEVFPTDIEYLLLDGTIQLAKKEFDKCIASFTKCIDYADDKVAMIIHIAFRFIIQEQEDIALQLLDNALVYSPESPSRRMVSAYRALAYGQLGNSEEFLSNLKQACEECPDILQNLFIDRFPKGMDPKDYYNYIINNPLS